MRYFIIAGEASGDLHASHLMHELKKADHSAEFCYFGGDLMEAEGGILLKHYREMAFMGLIPVLMNLHKIQENFSLAKEKLLEFKPDVMILVDYPGFNLPMAAFAKKHTIRVFYYISPKIWAWKTKRVYKVKKYVDEMFTIFPFESDFYEKYDYKVHYTGNPTVDEMAKRTNQGETFEEFIYRNNLPDKPVIALLAGSRSHEIRRILPVMKKAVKGLEDYQFVIAGAPSQSREIYEKSLEGNGIPIIFSQTCELLQQSKAALVASGTATLETAILNVPQVVCYRIEAGWLGGLIKRMIVKAPFISLVNLITGREVVKELFQETCTPKNVGDELERILKDSIYRDNMLRGYEEMRGKLGGPGCAQKAAEEMIHILRDDG